jgi:hypothetical protein
VDGRPWLGRYISMTPPEFLPPLNKDDALKFQENMDVLLGQIAAHELRLSHSYARLGARLREAEVEQHWVALGYSKFPHYLLAVGKKIGRERSQMYAFLSVATDLLPHLTEEQLEEIGISKAHQLRRLVKQGGSVQALLSDSEFEEGQDPPALVRIMDYAADPKVTAALLRVKVNELLHIKESPQGTWLEIGGFYADAGERKEISEFWELGRKVLETTSESEHEVRKQVFLAAVREARSTWAAEAGYGSN